MGVVLVGVALAFVIEWRVVSRQGHDSSVTSRTCIDDDDISPRIKVLDSEVHFRVDTRE